MSEIEADQLHEVIGKLLLRLSREAAVSDAVIDLWNFRDLLQKRNYAFAQPAEKSVAGFHVESFFILVQTVIVRILIGVDASFALCHTSSAFTRSS